jgi:hypothetical protein
MLEQTNAAHKGVRGRATTGYFGFSYCLYGEAKGGVTRAETGSNAGEFWWTASVPFGLLL